MKKKEISILFLIYNRIYKIHKKICVCVMCTSLTMTTKDNVNLLARTMDFSFELGASPVFIPRGHAFKSDVGADCTYISDYAFVGAGRKLAEYMFAGGVNEKGIGICALYFSGLA